MKDELKVRTERVDDIPLLLAQLQKMKVGELLDEQLERHGNCQGLSVGEVMMVWLAFIVSEGDHRMNQLEAWAEERRETLGGCLGSEVEAADCHIARLGHVLEQLSDGEVWGNYESELSSTTLRAYDLAGERARFDTTTARYYGEVDEQGMLRFGYSKDNRPDLPQLKVGLGVLDPLGMPLATEVVAGDKADDRLYLPAVARMRQSLGRSGVLYVGDSKLGSLDNRRGIAAAGDYYLCPLSRVQLPPAQLLEYLQPYLEQAELQGCEVHELEALRKVTRTNSEGQSKVIGYAFEVGESLGDQPGSERRIVSYSPSHAQAAQKRLEKRLEAAEQELASLTEAKRGKRLPKTREALQEAITAVLAKHKLSELLQVAIHEKQHQRQLRAYGNHPARSETTTTFSLTISRDEKALVRLKRTLGWRAFATNQPAAQLPLAQVVLVYHDEYQVEAGMARLKGRPLALTPMFLQREDHITGLVRLLSIALRVLTLLEFVVREALRKADEQLQGLYPGQPKRAAKRPRTETLLRAFKGITLSIITLKDGMPFGYSIMRYITELSTLHKRILALLGFSESLYTRLAARPASNLGS